MHYDAIENHTWKRRFTWGCFLTGFAIWSSSASGGGAPAALGVLVGVAVVCLGGYTLWETKNWHDFNVLPTERKIAPVVAVAVGMIAGLLIAAVVYAVMAAVLSSGDGEGTLGGRIRAGTAGGAVSWARARQTPNLA